jgi:hypothetical protein
LIKWPELLHTGILKTSVPITLLTEDGNIISSSSALADSILTNSQYFVGFGVELASNTWYQLKLSTQVTPTLTIGLAQLETTSDYLSSSRITYDSNPSFGYYFIQTTITPSSTLSVSISSPDPTIITTASKIYFSYLDITPSMSATLANFTVQLYYDAGVHLSGSAGLMDFRFVGDCEAQAACTGCTIY